VGAAPLRLAAAPVRARPARVAALAVLLLAAAAVATGQGADAARAPRISTADAASIVQAAFDAGAASPPVVAATRRLRAELGRRPLDARTRVLYAGVLADLVGSAADVPAPIFHARRAAALAPVTVPVIRPAAVVLMRCGETAQALALVRGMFAWDPRSAAALLALLEPWTEPGDLAAGIPEDAAAWSAWIQALRRAGRAADADRWLDDAQTRWPQDTAIFEAVAVRAALRRDWAALEAALAAGPRLVEEPRFAVLFATRSRLHAARGRGADARADAARAEGLAQERASVLVAAGEAHEAAGDLDAARGAWTRALWATPRDAARREARGRILARVARLEERRGRLGDALRAWRAVLDEVPAHPEARAGIERLTAP
jgi:tetratricopeptide (TPR) repeat protein